MGVIRVPALAGFFKRNGFRPPRPIEAGEVRRILHIQYGALCGVAEIWNAQKRAAATAASIERRQHVVGTPNQDVPGVALVCAQQKVAQSDDCPE